MPTSVLTLEAEVAFRSDSPIITDTSNPHLSDSGGRHLLNYQLYLFIHNTILYDLCVAHQIRIMETLKYVCDVEFFHIAICLLYVWKNGYKADYLLNLDNLVQIPSSNVVRRSRQFTIYYLIIHNQGILFYFSQIRIDVQFFAFI